LKSSNGKLQIANYPNRVLLSAVEGCAVSVLLRVWRGGSEAWSHWKL